MIDILTSRGKLIRYIPTNAFLDDFFLKGTLEASHRIQAPFQVVHDVIGQRIPDVIWVNAINYRPWDTNLREIAGLWRSRCRPIVVTSNSDETLNYVQDRILSEVRAVCLVGQKSQSQDTIVLGDSQFSGANEAQSPRYESLAEVRFAKILNHLSLAPDAILKSPVRRPMFAMIEIVRACNLLCPLCPVGNGTAIHHPNMSVELFTAIIQEIATTVFHLELYNYGEPLLHRELPKLVSIAKQHGVEWVQLTSNGTVLREGLPDALIHAELDLIRFAVDGASEETYSRYRVGGSLEAVWKNIEKLLDVRSKLRSTKPLIEAQFIVNRFNENEVSSFKERAKLYGVDRVKIKTFNALMSGRDFVEQGRAFLPKDKRQARYADYESLTIIDKSKLSKCEWPWRGLVVNADGSIVPCCYDYNARHKLGHFETNVGLWWNTKERDSFRATLERDPMSIDMCSICPIGIPSSDVHEEE